MDNKFNIKNRILKLLILFFVFMGVCTYLSGQIYYALLPEVVVQSAQSTTIISTKSVNGTAAYPDKNTVEAPGTLFVESVDVFNGQAVKNENVLARFSPESVTAAIIEQENTVDTLTAQRDRYYQSDDEYTVLDNKINEAKEYLDMLNEIDENSGVMYCPESGLVGTVYIKEGTYIDIGSPLVDICNTDTVRLYWSMTDIREQISQIEADVVCENENGSPEYQATQLNISGREYQPDSNTMMYWADINHEEVPYILYDREPVTISISSVKGDYDFVVPTSAVHFTDDVNGYVFLLKERDKIFGTEYYVVKENLTVVNQNDEQAALKDAVSDKVIISSSKAIDDQTVVKIVE